MRALLPGSAVTRRIIEKAETERAIDATMKHTTRGQKVNTKLEETIGASCRLPAGRTVPCTRSLVLSRCASTAGRPGQGWIAGTLHRRERPYGTSMPTDVRTRGWTRSSPTLTDSMAPSSRSPAHRYPLYRSCLVPPQDRTVSSEKIPVRPWAVAEHLRPRHLILAGCPLSADPQCLSLLEFPEDDPAIGCESIQDVDGP